MRRTTHMRGFSLVEVIVVSAIITLVFGGLFAGVRLAVSLVGHSKAESGARSLAVAKIEYIRSLPYEDVGTVGGIPPGLIPQTSTTTLNGTLYTERVLVQYLDRPEDGFGADDENGVTADSKVVKVEYTWELRGENRSLELVTDIIPQGIESTAGGGTLFLNVIDANSQPLPDASVHITNDTGTTTIDVAVTTNENGHANFPGAPALSEYQISATKDGYSVDQTYGATAENTNPQPPHVSVLEGEVSTVTFQIGMLSDLLLRAVSPPVVGAFTDSFAGTGNLYAQTNTVVADGALTLSGGAGAYASTGEALAASSTPAALESWDAFSFSGTTPTSTSLRIQLYSVSGSGTTTTYTLVPDSALPGNSTGFTASPVDLSGLDGDAYPSLALGASFTSSDPSRTPSLDEWELSHIESEQPIADVTFSVIGAKTVGGNASGTIPKYSASPTTESDGEALLSDLEWDTYTISVDGSTEGYDIIEARGILPYELAPGVSEDLTLVLDTHSTHSLRVTVLDTVGNPIPDATITLSLGAYEEAIDSSLYGQAYFGDLTADAYTIVVNADGYAQVSDTDLSISGATERTITLSGL